MLTVGSELLLLPIVLRNYSVLDTDEAPGSEKVVDLCDQLPLNAGGVVSAGHMKSVRLELSPTVHENCTSFRV
jgi:hypothetical protein